MKPWTPFPYSDAYPFTAASVRSQWKRLHAGDAEPCPEDAAVLDAWVLFHRGAFEEAARAGLAAGGAGITVANKATIVYANYLEPHEDRRLALLTEAAERASEQMRAEPTNPSAWFWHAYAIGRYSQGISVAKAMAQGLGSRVRKTLEQAIVLSPIHADARLALAVFHAEIIDKVGEMVGSMTYGARKASSLRLFEEAFAINPDSVIGKIEYANALLILEGDQRMGDATRLYEEVATTQPADALERLGVELAQTELAEG
ncbi:hypothetical protein [Acidovorax sp. SUPP2539]|uniref:hypothetical protein n=1 Tax=Acidovorax sp. SUPP2539 TaxID=2920878 RepID=UPI0023DE6298|nr:hypothetical protein [Acidovorax sp. SUPP2539]GKS92007.1 tetratricopeptide repeat protein [Acidovorax sp. SUPP2539]